MKAKDVMTTSVISAHRETEVREIAGLLLKHRISAVPVVDADKRIVGIVSEGDLIRRSDIDTEHRHSWWLEAIFAVPEGARDYIKSHGRTAADVMTKEVVTVPDDTPLHEIARLLEKHHIKRVPVTRDEELVGIVSRANLLHGLVAKGAEVVGSSSSNDQTIREELQNELSNNVGIDSAMINVIVNDGAVQLWGIVANDEEKRAAQVAAENVSGVKSIDINLRQVPPWVSAV